MANKSLSIFSDGERESVFNNSNQQIALLTLSRASDETKIEILKKICDHFGVDSRRMVKKIQQSNNLNCQSNFWQSVEKDGIDDTIEICRTKRNNGKMW